MSDHDHFLPLPDQAQPIDNGPDGHRIQRAGEKGYVVLSGIVQSAFVVTDEGVIVVDAPPASVDHVVSAVASVTDKPVTHFIYSHSHNDHVGGVTKFPGAIRIAHEEARRLIAFHNDPARPVPDLVVDGPQNRLTIGGEVVDLIYPGPNHEVGNILIHFPAQKLSIMTDVVMPGWAPYRGWGNADYPPGMLAAHDAILATDFDTYVGGHVYRAGTRSDVEQSRELFLDLWTTAGKKMGEVAFPDPAPGNPWAAQAVWISDISDQVVQELTERWGDKVGAIDTSFTKDTVAAAIVSISTDAPIKFP
jgi:glyoxylase-like metal-dependent hydrolase (beta-lactamase superfamily II)